MQYWRGSMNWPLDIHWTCEICGTGPFMLAGLMANSNLTWGFIHAQCRCDTCHTEYWMRDSDQQIVATPICGLKDKYKEPARILWERDKIPIDDITRRFVLMLLALGTAVVVLRKLVR